MLAREDILTLGSSEHSLLELSPASDHWVILIMFYNQRVSHNQGDKKNQRFWEVDTSSPGCELVNSATQWSCDHCFKNIWNSSMQSGLFVLLTDSVMQFLLMAMFVLYLQNYLFCCSRIFTLSNDTFVLSDMHEITN